MSKQTLWTPTRRELILMSGLGLAAGCSGGGSSPGPNPIPTPTPVPTPTPTPTPQANRTERFGYVERTSTGFRLASMKVDGTDHGPISMPEQPNIYEPTWSRNGARIAYTVQDFARNRYDIYVMNGDGSEHRHYAEGMSPAWNADGTLLAFLTMHQEVSGAAARTYMTVHAHNVVTNTQALPYVNAPPMYLVGPWTSSQLLRPVWNGDSEVYASCTTKLGTTQINWCLARYYSNLMDTSHNSDTRSIVLHDIAPNDGMGIVSQSVPGESYTVSEVSWRNRGNLQALKGQSTSGGGVFSPDGNRLWINLDNGRGSRFYDRNLNEVGAPGPLPNSAYISWFAE
ncbi:MAG: hypothetical protein QM758_20655 [Armatimonas sp.]